MDSSNSEQPSKTEEEGKKSSFGQDFLASIVVFLVALPLCMGIAIASGAPVAAGLITGIVGGFIVGWISGAPLQVSGPAAGLTVIIFELVQTYGLKALGLAVMIGGALQLLAGLLRYGRWFRAVSPAVIHGMLAGIGVLIFSSQFHVMVDDSPKGSGIQNLMSIPSAIKKGLPIPELGTEEDRTARRDLLISFGALHEEQVQIRELADEQSPTKTIAKDDDKVPSSQPQQPIKVAFGPLAKKQLKLSNSLSAVVTQMKSQGVATTARSPVELNKAVTQLLSDSRIALADFQSGNPDKVSSSQAKMQRSLEEVLNQLKSHDWAAKLGLLTIIVLLAWTWFVPKKLRLVPAPLVAIVFVTTLAVIFKLPVLYVEVPDSLWSEIHFPSLGLLQSESIGGIFQAGVVLAIVASAETLLCASAVDQLQSHTKTNYDKELAAQGIGNMVCGLLGGLPMTGVIVRSSANVAAGARTRTSTILHGLWLIVFVLLLGFVLRMIPTAALAAMLVYIGFKLVNVKAIQDLKKYGWGEVVVYFGTLGTIVCTDLLTGVIVGVVLSAVKLLHKFSHLIVDLDLKDSQAKLSLEGAATFIRLPVLAAELERVPGNTELHVDFEHLNHIDHACLDLLMNWAKQHEVTGGTLVIDWDSLHARFQ
jgi:MFS superfamily sulfate permease-like transporter